jgi:transposase
MARRFALVLGDEVRQRLEHVSRSRTEAAHRVQRSKVLLAYANGRGITAIAQEVGLSRPSVYAILEKARAFGALAALEHLKGERGRPRAISEGARAWLVNLACQKPRELGYPHELWTRQLLARHAREHCHEADHLDLSRVSAGTVTKILQASKLKPHKVRYYVERRDPDFDRKMVEVLHFYREVQLVRDAEAEGAEQMVAFLSYDEKPGIQALESKGTERPPVPGRHPSTTRDYEYVRHGTLALMAGIDLVSGEILARVEPRTRSREFVEWLKMINAHYPESTKIRILLDNHSAHTSKETRRYLETVPGRFEFLFTPTHGSWLNLIENLFSKLARTILREMRVQSREELRTRLRQAIDWLNEQPVVFKWEWGLGALPASSLA